MFFKTIVTAGVQLAVPPEPDGAGRAGAAGPAEPGHQEQAGRPPGGAGHRGLGAAARAGPALLSGLGQVKYMLTF